MSSTTSTAQVTHNRRKSHKAGKVVSLSILWPAIALFVATAAIPLVLALAKNSEPQQERDVSAVTSSTQDNQLQPVSPKIVASDTRTMTIIEDSIDASDYADVWRSLGRLAPASATPEQRQQAMVDFLAGLDYESVAIGGVIVSKSNGTQISPSTVACYLNGYIPDKPYIKVNCPVF